MTLNDQRPTPGDDPRLRDELRRRRADVRAPGTDLVPVEGGEPIPAEAPEEESGQHGV